MTDRARTSLGKISAGLGIIITIVTLIAGGVRIVDLTSQTASTVAILSNRIEAEQTERILQDSILKDAIMTEREERKLIVSPDIPDSSIGLSDYQIYHADGALQIKLP